MTEMVMPSLRRAEMPEEREEASNPAMHGVTGRRRVGHDPDDYQDRNNDADEPR
jgi:hypothetical protein